MNTAQIYLINRQKKQSTSLTTDHPPTRNVLSFLLRLLMMTRLWEEKGGRKKGS
jgi:hypothetical protein